jgi:3-deoxy-D-manno-octulosonic-acid transferase
MFFILTKKRCTRALLLLSACPLLKKAPQQSQRIYNSKMLSIPNNLIYTLLLTFLSPVLLLWLLREAWQQKSWAWLNARLGKTTPIQADIWLHCASVGEVNAAAPLVEALQAQGKQLLITTFTPTGQQQAQRRFANLPNLHIRLLPIDWAWTVSRFMSHVNCQQLWLVETEFWPTLITQVKQRGMRINLINARITHKTLNAPHWWRRLLVRLLNEQISDILCRNEQDLADFQQLSVTNPSLRIAGNLKWCDTPPADLPRLYPDAYLVFASTHQPEEIELATLWQQHPELPKLVIVPRHPKRGNDIAQQLSKANITFSQRSIAPEQTSGIILSDTFGELQAWMAYAELVIMGGSFAPKGGQNPLEAIRLGKLVLCGADMRDFAQEVEALMPTGALIQTDNMNDLLNQVIALLSQPKTTAQRATSGQHWLATNQGQILETYYRLAEQTHGLS